MELTDQTIVITGAASGIGRAMARRFQAEGPRAIVCVDLNADGAEATARERAWVAVGLARKMKIAATTNFKPIRSDPESEPNSDRVTILNNLMWGNGENALPQVLEAPLEMGAVERFNVDSVATAEREYQGHNAQEVFGAYDRKGTEPEGENQQ